MTVRSPVVEVATDLLAVGISDVSHGCAIGSKPIRDNGPGRAITLHRFSEKLKSRGFVSGFGNLAFQYFADMTTARQR